MGTVDTLLDYRSFAKAYWAAWFAILIAFAASCHFAGFKYSFPCFVLISSLFGGYVFNFEFGRYSGFLHANHPAHIAAMEKRFLFRAFPFFHVALWQDLFFNSRPLSPRHSAALAVFRSSAIFSGVGLIAPLALLPLYFPSYAVVT